MQVLDASLTAGLPTISAHGDSLDASHQGLAEAFPAVDPQFKPFGTKVVVQIRRTITKSKGGIILGTETKETEAWNTQIGKVVAAGPLAFKDRATGKPWPEGVWANIGDYVRFQRHVGDRLAVPLDDGNPPVVFLILNDNDLTGAYTGDPLKVRAFIQ